MTLQTIVNDAEPIVRQIGEAGLVGVAATTGTALVRSLFGQQTFGQQMRNISNYVVGLAAAGVGAATGPHVTAASPQALQQTCEYVGAALGSGALGGGVAHVWNTATTENTLFTNFMQRFGPRAGIAAGLGAVAYGILDRIYN